MYEIQNRSRDWGYRQWSPDGIGGPNEFETEAEAVEVIEALRELGEDWAEAEYRVREIEGSVL